MVGRRYVLAVALPLLRRLGTCNLLCTGNLSLLLPMLSCRIQGKHHRALGPCFVYLLISRSTVPVVLYVRSTNAAFISGVTIWIPHFISCSTLHSFILMGWNFLRKCAEKAFSVEADDICTFSSSSIVWFISRLAWRFRAVMRWYKEGSSPAVLSCSAVYQYYLSMSIINTYESRLEFLQREQFWRNMSYMAA